MRAIDRTLLDAAIGEEGWPQALARLAASFGGFESNFMVLDRMRSRVAFSAWADYPHQETTSYARCENLVRARAGHLILTQKIPEKIFLRDEIYNEFLRPLGTRYLMGVKLADLDSNVATLRIHRRAKDGPFSSADARKFAMSFADFSRAARIHLNKSHLAQRETMAAAALDRLQLGVIVIDRERHILHVNALARDVLTQGGIVAARDRRLTLTDAEADRALGHAIDEARVRPDSLAAAALGLRCLRAGDCQLSISPFVDDGSFALHRLAPEAYLVTLKSVERLSGNLAARLCSEFPLTPTEASIVEQIVQGSSLQQVAVRKSISINTIKTHLKSIFSKMDIKSQADLVRLVLGSALMNLF